MHRLASLAYVALLAGLSQGAAALDLGQEFRNALQDALRQAASGNQQAQGQPSGAATPQGAGNPGAPNPQVMWQVKAVSSGIVEVNGQVPPDYDLGNPEIATRVYREGCRAGGGGYGDFGSINAIQNGYRVAQGNLRGCDGPSAGFTRNTVAEMRAKEREKAAHLKARESDQGIGNVRGLEAELVKELNAQVVALKAHHLCKGGCKEFTVFCNAPDRLGSADKANGISEKRFVGIEWLRFGGAALPGGLIISDNKKWHEELLFKRYAKVNGTWKAEQFSGYDPQAVCGRGR